MLREPPGITYAKSVEQLGVTPVYPPREDIQVGDIYAVELHTSADRLDARTAYIASRNLLPQINAYLGSRYNFADKGIETDGLPINSFPQIEVNSGVSLGLGGSPQGLMASLGLTLTKTLRMTLQFTGVVSYEVSIPQGMDELGGFCKTSYVCQAAYLPTFINQRYQLRSDEPGSVKAAGVMMVTKVYLAKKITYTFNDAQLAAAAASALEEGKTPAAVPVVTQEQIDQAISADNPEMIKALASLMATAKTSADAGGSVSIAVSAISTNKVSFTEEHARPIVIGYEAVSMQGVTQ